LRIKYFHRVSAGNQHPYWLKSRYGKVSIFQLNDRYDIDGKALGNKARYINHSYDPNCTSQVTARTIWIVALRDISAGEELTYNYGYELNRATRH
jgi:uncharacterized protein